MKHLFVEYPIALELKNKGFSEECMARWFKVGGEKPIFILNTSPSNENNDIITIAPLYQQVIDFLFKFGYFIQTGICGDDTIFMVIYHKNNGIIYNEKGFKDNYEALNKAIEQALKLI
jgi:hypothetical protein